jgi:putative aldouronate transport system substrate-binding protein
MVRQDWLDQVGMQAPTTIDEITAVAKAFKEAGISEYPIAVHQNLISWDFSADPIFGAYGIVPASGNAGYWLKMEDGSLGYSSIQPGAKEALTVLNNWYTEGLIDPDFMNQDETSAGDNFLAGLTGIVFQPWWAAHANVIDLYSAFPEAKISLIANPKGPDGKSGRAGTSPNGSAILFRAGVDPKIVEAVIKHMNWQMEMHINWEKYQQYGEYSLGAGYFQGYEWDFDENCNMVLGKVPGGEWTLGKDLMGGYRGMTYPDYPVNIFASMAEWMKADPATLNMAQKFIINDPTVQRDIEYYNFAVATRDEIIHNEFKGRNTEAINAVLPDLLDFERTAYLEFISGAQ